MLILAILKEFFKVLILIIILPECIFLAMLVHFSGCLLTVENNQRSRVSGCLFWAFWAFQFFENRESGCLIFGCLKEKMGVRNFPYALHKRKCTMYKEFSLCPA